jgi:hypothetical protein
MIHLGHWNNRPIAIKVQMLKKNYLKGEIK